MGFFFLFPFSFFFSFLVWWWIHFNLYNQFFVKKMSRSSQILTKFFSEIAHEKGWSSCHSCVSWCLWGNSGSYPNPQAPQNAKWPFSYTKYASRFVTTYVNEIAEELYDKNLKVNFSFAATEQSPQLWDDSPPELYKNQMAFLLAIPFQFSMW